MLRKALLLAVVLLPGAPSAQTHVGESGIIGEKRPRREQPRLNTPYKVLPAGALKLKSLPPADARSIVQESMDRPKRFDIQHMRNGEDELIVTKAERVTADEFRIQPWGRVELHFRAQQGYRYMVDCAVSDVRKAYIGLTVKDYNVDGRQNIGGAEILVQSGIAVHVTGPIEKNTRAVISVGAIGASGNSDLPFGFKACDVTPIRPAGR